MQDFFHKFAQAEIGNDYTSYPDEKLHTKLLALSEYSVYIKFIIIVYLKIHPELQ